METEKTHKKPGDKNKNCFSIGCGIDIESSQRFQRDTYKVNDPFFKRIFTKRELKYCFSYSDPAQHLAGKFACKEAVFKALSQAGHPISDISIIEVINNTEKIPSIVCKEIDSESVKISVSISHTTDLAVASAVILFV